MPMKLWTTRHCDLKFGDTPNLHVNFVVMVYFRVAYCQDNNCDPKDPLDKFIDDLKGKLDISWDKIQDSLLNDQMKETVSLIGSILESLKQFDMPEIEYLTPRPILLLLLKVS